MCVCVCVVIVHWHCSARLSMFNMEKRYRNKIIIIIILLNGYRRRRVQLVYTTVGAPHINQGGYLKKAISV